MHVLHTRRPNRLLALIASLTLAVALLVAPPLALDAGADTQDARGISGVCPSPGAQEAEGFTDLDSHAHESGITCVASYGVAQGYPDGDFRPNERVTRGQMATFIAKTVEAGAGVTLDGSVPDEPYVDTAGTAHATSINKVTNAGIAQGFDDGRFRPNSLVTRGQMATLLANAIDYVATGSVDGTEPPPSQEEHFDDVAGTTHASAINRLAAQGIVVGFDGDSYGPRSLTSRGQMATMIMRAADYLDEIQEWVPTVFVAWYQGFDTGTAGWIGSEVEGAEGWCGEHEWRAAGTGPVEPSAGDGYALVRHGDCNDFWAEVFPDGSAPYSPGAGYFNAWPRDGYDKQFDVYLDPAYNDDDGHVFSYAIALRDLDYDDFVESLRYFMVSVTKDGGALFVSDYEVDEAGWYTFRHTISEGAEGELALDLTVLRDGRTLHSEALTTTAFSEEATSSFTAANIGTGYVWFAGIADGLDLPIDEHIVNRSVVFTSWYQGFETDAAGWIGSEVEGPEGWCGTYERHDAASGPVAPSVGDSYLVVNHGECNDFWAEVFPDGSAPYSPGAGYFDAWPLGGFDKQFDVYLDPAYDDDDGHVFSYAIAIRDLRFGDFLESLRYFMVPVTKGDDALDILGNEVDEAGWYTFRHTFSEGTAGEFVLSLTVLREGSVVFTEPLTTTAFSGEATWSFPAASVGTGYVWFAGIVDGLDLPIDEHVVRREG